MATQLAQRPQQETRPANPLVSLRSELEQRSNEFRMALPSHITPEKFQRTILTAAQSNPKLLEADRRSFLTACMKAAQDGLLPDGREAALVEFQTSVKVGNEWKKIRLVQYMPMVYGLRKKILQSNEVKDIFATVVYRQEVEAGLFVYEEGTERMLRHKPCLDPDFEPKDEDIVAAYSIATFADGSKSFEVMRRSEINKVRQCSQTGALGQTVKFGPNKGQPIEPKGPWVDWFSEQCKKTVVRRHSKMLPMSGDLIDVEAMDDAAAARSSTALLGSAEPEAPAPSLPRRDDFVDDTPHDDETGEVIDVQATETTAEPAKDKPKQQRQRKKPEQPEERPQLEGRDQSQTGEEHNGTGGAEPITLDQAKARIDEAELVADVNSRVRDLVLELATEAEGDELRSYALDRIEQLKGDK